MLPLVFKLIGGIGLFLLGMVLLTDGLKAFAGEALRRALVRFTGTPLKAFTSGALVTLVVQSSSATTVTVIGFVSAGLLAFPQAVGVVMGASLGTTGTGWIVSVLGLKVSVGFYALPVVGIGAFMRLLGSGRWRSLGFALAGFGIIFIGIESLQEAMEGLSGVLRLQELPSSGFLGHLIAMAIGIVLTIVMQSSSAAIATTLTALHAGSLNFDQAASLVIGAAIGTTVTGALAAIGGSVPAKRTALAHILFNLSTGLIALLLLPLFLRGIAWAQANLGLDPGATSLAAFHTAFIAAGVLIFLPFVRAFSRRIEHLLPEHDASPTRHLDDSLLQAPSIALEATRRALRETAVDLVTSLDVVLSPEGRTRNLDMQRGRIAGALDRIQQFFTRIPPVGEDEPLSQLRVGQMHAIDHLTRLLSRLEPSDNVRLILADPRLKPTVEIGRSVLAQAASGLGEKPPPGWLAKVATSAAHLADLRRQERPKVLNATSGGTFAPVEALEVLDAMRWLDRVGYHTWRLSHYLDANLTSDAKASSTTDASHPDPAQN
jgi:phosphate:Na+ symporter